MSNEILNQLGGYKFTPQQLQDPTIAFINEHLPYAERLAQQRGLDPRVIIGQMAYESGWGKSNGATNGSYNYGNINEVRENMPAVWENDKTADGQVYRAKRRIFSNLADMYRYKNALYDQNLKGVVGAYTPQQFADAIVKSKYAEDKQYGDQMTKMYNSVAKRMPGYEWKQTTPQAGFNALDELAGAEHSGNWGVVGAQANFNRLTNKGKDNFGILDPQQMTRR